MRSLPVAGCGEARGSLEHCTSEIYSFAAYHAGVERKQIPAALISENFSPRGTIIALEAAFFTDTVG